ncbi:SpoIIE family protein phosphatase [Nonomuraea sp. NPDC050536]|uniref:SpoIIE family protein phosphatase n=1 Tax=Nonomuraea sp. NPDC050536 TaxID=3364366 RepID=UPI0037C955E3
MPARSGIDAVLAAGGTMGALMRVHDWTQTALGPLDTWPQSLRSSVSICLASEFPMVIFWGPQLALLYNDAYLPALGRKHPRSLGQPAAQCWYEIWPTIEPMLAQVMEEGRATYSHDLLLILRRSGFPEECYFRFSYSPIRDETGGVGGVFCAVTETTKQIVTERRLAIVRELGEGTRSATTTTEACLRAAEVLSRHPTDVPFALLYLLSPDGGQADLVATAGLGPAGPLSPAHVDLAGGDDPWRLAEARDNLVEVTCPAAPELAELARAGFDPPSRALVLPIIPPGAEQPAGLLVAGVNSGRPLDDTRRDFTRFVAGQIAAAVADATALEVERHRSEQLAEIDRAKTMFFSNISHEFRTPLTLLLGPAEDLLAEQGALGEADRERVEMIHRNALRLLKLVNALLDFSQAEAGRIQPRFEQADLAALTTELASLFQVPLERSGLDLVIDCRPLPRPVTVDRDMWEKIVLNLLSNAFKFTLHGQISVSLDAVGDQARLVVSDSGAGIPAEELPRLFDRFHRVAGTTARSEEGAGIGLSLVRELVHQHGGTITVDSTVGAGSTFTVLLPFSSTSSPVGPIRDGTPDDVLARAYVEEAMSWSTQSSTAQGSPAEVLIVDDNADMRRHLTRILSRYWRVQSVPNGQAALEAIARGAPELVLADVMMPGLDGFGLLKQLRAGEETRHIPVIMVSARAGQEATVEGLDAGADDYLVKPFTSTEAVARVRAHLQTARERRQAAARIARLADITQRFNASLDPSRIGQILCEQMVPAYASGCAVWVSADMSDDEDVPRSLALRGSASTDDLPQPARAALGEPPVIPAPATSGQPAVLTLRCPDRVIGAVTLALPTPAVYDSTEGPFLMQLLDRAAAALDNAARFERERQIALHLQQSLLPPALPSFDDIRLAGRYLPGAGQRVGGDWYDVLPLPGGRIALVIGDVMGQGVRAAALMGRLRTAIHAYVLAGLPPEPLLERLNIFLERGDQRDLTTLCYAIYDPAARRLQVCNAGHLPPVLLHDNGPAELLEVHHGLALGVDSDFRYTSQTFTLPPGATLLLYTDGLVETRTEPIGERLATLCTSLSGASGDPDQVCARALQAMGIHDADDDVAMLALRHTAGTGPG